MGLPTASWAPDNCHALQSLRLPGSGSTDHDDRSAVGVDHDLVVGGVPIVLGLLGYLVVAGRHEVAVHPGEAPMQKHIALFSRVGAVGLAHEGDTTPG
jgi:hypothetical protein